MGISVEGANKRFGDFQALDDVSIEVPNGSLTALLALMTLLAMNFLKRKEDA
jgi:ABC-type multidrug transport system ATPase subunit